MFTTQWHLSLFAQRWSSVHFSAQRQSSVNSLHKVHDIIYDRPLSQGLLLGATEGPLSHWSSHSVHVSHPIASSFMMQLVLMVTTVGTNTAAILNGSWGTLQTSSGDWSLCKQAVTLIKPGSGITHQTISNSLVGDGGLTGWSAPLAHWFEVVKPAFPLNSDYDAFA